MNNQIWLGTFHFYRKAPVTVTKNGRKVTTLVTEELHSDPFILGNEQGKCNDTLYIGRALRTKGIERSDKTAYAKWTDKETVKISCKLIKQIISL